MTEYVIGVDVGGTKSHLVLFDTAGNKVDFGRWGPLNHEGLPGSYAQFESEFGQFLNGVISRHGINMSQITNAVLGVAGVDTRKQHSTISGILTRLGFGRFTLVNDAFLGIPAGSRTGTGICAINGTGCTLAGINKEGKTLQIGGVGYLSADPGGGGYTVYCDLFRKGEPTYLTALMFEYLSITSKYDFIERIYEKTGEGSYSTKSLGGLLFEAAEKNDRAAIGIIHDVAECYAGGISCMIDEMNYQKDDEINIVLAGSVFVKEKNPILRDILREMINKDRAGYNINYITLNE